MGLFRRKIGKQGKWHNALFLFIAPLFLIFIIRWIWVEPFVIPSESMMPNLLIHDHIYVTKYDYGIRKPLGDGWLLRYKEPRRGDIIVFRYPENRDVFYIKRLIGLPGDKLKIQNGQITVNGQPWVIRNLARDIYSDEDDFIYFQEVIPAAGSEPEREHLVRYFNRQAHIDPKEKEYLVPQGSYFVMGDNRDQSHDSRFWGFVDEKYLVGSAARIWLSCDSTIPTAPMICDPLKLRPDRIFKVIGSP